MIYQGDALTVLKTLPGQSVHCCVTSPPYWGLRDYGVEGQLGLEKSPEEYVSKMVEVFREVRRILRDDGTLWLNLGDSYARGRGGDGLQTANIGSHLANRPANIPAGLKPKDLVGIPWRVAFALQQDGWYLRQDIIWHKPNPMPESVRDRCTKSHEYIFLLAKSQKYYFESKAIHEETGKTYTRKASGYTIKETQGCYDGRRGLGFATRDIVTSGRNKRSVWTVTTKPFKGAHFATFPPDLIEPCILAGSPVGGIILDPFFGAGTVGLVALKHNRQFIGIELNPDYIAIAKKRIYETPRP